MSFLYPLAAAFALAAGPLIYLYLRRPQRTEIIVPSLMFWADSRDLSPERPAFGRVRNPLDLALGLLVFALILLALMRPEIGEAPPARSVLVLDAGIAMQAGAGRGEAAFARAQAQALEFARRAGDGREVLVVRALGVPQVLGPSTQDARRAAAAVEAATVTDGPSDVGAAIEFALRAAGEPAPRVVVFTNNSGPLPEGVERVRVGEPGENVALTAAGSRVSGTGPGSRDLFARVENFGASAVDGEIEIRADGRLLDVVPVAVGGGEAAEVSLEIDARQIGESGRIEVAFARRDPGAVNDALPGDDVARIAVTPGAGTRVLLVSEGNLFLERAFGAIPGIGLEIISPEFWKPGFAAGFDAVVLDGWMPEGDADDWLTTGNFLVFGSHPWAADAAEEGDLAITDADGSHPLMRGVPVERARVRRAYPESDAFPASGREIAMRSGEIPLAFAIEDPESGKRFAAFSFSLADTDLPLRAAFPLLVANAVAWLGRRDESRPVEAGSLLTLGSGERIVAEDGTLREGAFYAESAGFYDRVAPGGEARPVAVNPAGRATDLRGAGAGGDGESEPPPPATGNPALWRWLLLAALLAGLTQLAVIAKPARFGAGPG